MSCSFTIDRDTIIAREVAMLFIKHHIYYDETRIHNFGYIWLSYQLWLQEQYMDNVKRIISTTEFRELLEFKFDNCVVFGDKYKLSINIQHN